MSRGKKPPPCPKCGSTEVVPIFYGLPSDASMKMAERGEVVLGGCCVEDDDPEWACRDCDHRWPGVEKGKGGRQ